MLPPECWDVVGRQDDGAFGFLIAVLAGELHWRKSLSNLLMIIMECVDGCFESAHRIWFRVVTIEPYAPRKRIAFEE